MPSQQANIGDFRKGRHFLRCYMSVYVGAVVVNGTVTYANPAGATDIQIAYNTGAHTDLEYGMEVVFFDSTGTQFKGRTHLRNSGVITSGSIPVREYSPAALQLVPGDKVKIYNEFRLHDKMTAAEPGFSPERLFYTDEGSNPPPLPNSGGAWAGKPPMLPVVFTGDTSALVDPDSSTPVTHLWDIDGLNYTSGNATSANPQVSGAAGTYLVKHTVTDPDNGKSITQHIPVIIDDAPYKVVIEDLPNDEARGGSARVRMLQNVTLDAVPDGALCILWKEEWIAGVRQSFGARAPGRSHILFVGYLRREEGEFDSDDGVEGLTFELISPLARLEELMGYGKILLNEASPDGWHEMKALTVKRAIIQLPMFYTNYFESGGDLRFTSSYSDRAYSGFALQQSTPLGQMRELAKNRHARVICDRRGSLEVQMRPERMALADRVSLPVTLTLSRRDVLSWRYTREHWNPLSRVEVRGFIAGAAVADNLPIFSLYYGDAPGTGNQQTVEEGLIVTDQAELNVGAGMIGAALAGEYVDANGVRHPALDLEITLRGTYDVFDFYDEVIALDWTTLRRGLDLSAAQYVYVGGSVDLSNGTAETTVRLRTCTAAPMGTTYIPPTESTPPYTPPEDIPIPWVPPLPPLLPESGRIPAYLFALDRGGAHAAIATSWNPLTGDAAWVDVSVGLSGAGIFASADPWDYNSYFVVTENGIFRAQNVFTGFTGWSSAGSNAALFGGGSYVGNQILMSINRAGYLFVPSGDTGGAYSFNYGNSWTQTALDGGIPSFGTDPYSLVNAGTALSTFNNGSEGWLYAVLGTPFTGIALYKSADWGANFSLINSSLGFDTNIGAAARLALPYTRIDGATHNINDGQQELYIVAGSGNRGQVNLSQTAGISVVGQLYQNGGGVPTPVGAPGQRTLVPQTYDGADLIQVLRRTLLPAQFWASDDAGVTYPTKIAMPDASSRYGINGSSTTNQFAIMWSPDDSVITATVDRGATLITINPPSFFTGNPAYVEGALYGLQ